MKFLHGTRDDVLTLSKGRNNIQLEWYVDASFAIHPDYRGHTGAALKFKHGKGCPIQKSSKQKLNASSSTTSELIGVDDILPKMIWVPLFLKEQGYKIENNDAFQDNTSAILLEGNGRKSTGERTRVLNVQYFMIMDHVNKGDLKLGIVQRTA